MTLTESTSRAARLYLGPDDAEVRMMTRNAPAWMKRRIDTARQRRGSRPLWSANDADSQRVVAKMEALRAFLDSMRQQAAQRTS